MLGCIASPLAVALILFSIHGVTVGEKLEIRCLDDRREFCAVRDVKGFIFNDGCRLCQCLWKNNDVQCRKGSCEYFAKSMDEAIDYCEKVQDRNDEAYQRYAAMKHRPNISMSLDDPAAEKVTTKPTEAPTTIAPKQELPAPPETKKQIPSHRSSKPSGIHLTPSKVALNDSQSEMKRPANSISMTTKKDKSVTVKPVELKTPRFADFNVTSDGNQSLDYVVAKKSFAPWRKNQKRHRRRRSALPFPVMKGHVRHQMNYGKPRFIRAHKRKHVIHHKVNKHHHHHHNHHHHHHVQHKRARKHHKYRHHKIHKPKRRPHYRRKHFIWHMSDGRSMFQQTYLLAMAMATFVAIVSRCL